MRDVFIDSQKELHDQFTRTYGVLYERNSNVFDDYFSNLARFYHGTETRTPEAATEAFFTDLYEKMFQVMNAQYTFDKEYLVCVKRTVPSVRPFGEIPNRVAANVARSVEATRAVSAALKSASEIAASVSAAAPSGSCGDAVKRMNACPTCRGKPEERPCNAYCVNIMKGCLAFHLDLQQVVWDKFAETLMDLTERLTGGPFNVETNVLNVDISISDAIMQLQESMFHVTQKVFGICGTPRIVKRQAEDEQGTVQKVIHSSQRWAWVCFNTWG